VRAIYYGIHYKYRYVKFRPHFLLNAQIIEISQSPTLNDKKVVSNDFFNLKKLGINDPPPYKMKEIFQEYIKPIFKIHQRPLEPENNKIYIHFRGGDIFGCNPHRAYVQPPLEYYTDIIKNYKEVILVCQDNNNPCINELLKMNSDELSIKYESNTLDTDLAILNSAKHLVLGFGTFGFLIYMMNTELENLYIPRYWVEEMPEGSWGNSPEIYIKNLPNYIKVGEWRNTPGQRQFMLNYKTEVGN